MLLSPLTIFWILCLTALGLYFAKRIKAARIVILTAFTILFIFSVSPLPVVLIKNLEDTYPVYNGKANSENLPVLVLGGGHTNAPSLPSSQQLSVTALSRLSEGIRIFRLTNSKQLILSGYTITGKHSQAELMAITAIGLGVNAKDTITLTKPATTWDEAKEFKKRFGTGKKFILVTSASHMPRAIQTFKNAGLNPVPAPANFQVKDDPNKSEYNWWPSAKKIVYTEKALHEYVGMLYYKWCKE